MYKITDFHADAIVTISLLCKDKSKEMYTRWELCSTEIDLGEVDFEFKNKPYKEEIEKHVTELFKRYIEDIMSSYTVRQMSMSVYDENHSEMNDEGVNWEDVLELGWGEVIYLCSYISEYKIEVRE